MTDRRRAGPPTGRRRPPPGRLSPQALADARGGAVEGLAWLGRTPESQGVAALPARPPARPVPPVRRLPVPDRRRPARSTCRAAATSSSARPIAAGWTRSSSSTPCPSSRGSGSSAARRRRSRRAGGRRSIHRLGGLLPVWRGGIGVDQHVASARAVVAQRRASSPRCRRGRSADRPGRIGPFRVGWALIALRTGAPIVPFAMAGTEELYVGRRMASRVLPATSVAGLLGAGWDGAVPGRRAPARSSTSPGG